MRCNGKNLRPKLLDDASSWSWDSGDLNSGLHCAAYLFRHVDPHLCLAFVRCQKGLDQPFLPNRVAKDSGKWRVGQGLGQITWMGVVAPSAQFCSDTQNFLS